MEHSRAWPTRRPNSPDRVPFPGWNELMSAVRTPATNRDAPAPS